MAKMYWYSKGTLTYVVFASDKRIATWLVGCEPLLRGARFLREDTRSATGYESVTVSAFNADRSVCEEAESWKANGGGEEHQRKLDRLAKLVGELMPSITNGSAF